MQLFEKKQEDVGSMLTGQPCANVPAAIETRLCVQDVFERDQEGRVGRSITGNSYIQAVTRHFLFLISS